jgi:hypothetical protein
MGAGMLGQWAMFFAAGRVPEVRTAPVALAFHLAGEALTALSLITAGLGLLRGAAWAKPLYLFALGLFTYTAVVSPGYFAQIGDWPFVAMFAAFLAAAVPAARQALGA